MKKYLPSLIILIFILILYTFISFTYFIEYPNSPDESQVIFFSENYKKTGSLTWKSELNEKYDTKHFRPRGSVEVGENLYAMLVSPHFVLIYSTYSLFLGEKLIIMLFSLFGILFFYLFVKEISNKKFALFATPIFAIFPSYLFYSMTISDLITSITILLISFYFLIKFSKNNESKFLFFSLFFFTLSILIRIHNTLFFLLYIPFLWKNSKISIIKNKALFVFSLSLLFLLLINFFVYGSPFTTGRILTGESDEERTLINKIILYGINPEFITVAFNNYFMQYSLPFFLFAFVGFLLLFKNNNYFYKKVKWFVLLIFLIFIIYFGSNNTFFNFYNISPQGSLARYFMPIYLFLIISTTYFIIYQKNNTIRVFLIFSIILSLVLFTFGSTAFVSLINNKHASYEINEWTSTLPNNSIFLVKQADKFVIPYGNVFLIYGEEDLKKHPTIEGLYPLINVNETLKIIKEVDYDGYDIYLSKEESRLKQFLIEDDDVNLESQNRHFYKLIFRDKSGAVN